MNHNSRCSECANSRLLPSTWSAEICHGEATLHVEDLECYRCDHCGADPVHVDQIRRNDARIADARGSHDGLC